MLFRKSRPLIRKYEQSDAGFLWAAYRSQSLPLPDGLGQSEFLVEMDKLVGGSDLLWIVEDDNSNFKSGRGQIGLVALKTDGWKFEPKAYFFKWVTAKNLLRALVAFFQMVRYQKTIGVCRVEVEEGDVKKLSRLKKYGVLYFRGRIPFGNQSGDVFLFSINGKKT